MNQTRKRLKKIWPDLKLIWPTDPHVYIPPLAGMRKVVKKSKAGLWDFEANYRACEEFALEFMVETKRLRALDGTNYNWAVGFVFALTTKITKDLSDPRHHLNICDTQEGIYLIDIRSKQIWSPTDEDQVVALLM